MKSGISLEILNDNEEPKGLADFIENSANGTVFHRPKFLSYHGNEKFPKPEFLINHIIFRENGNDIAAFLPGIIQTEGTDVKFNSPYGASFGGLVTGNLRFEKCEQVVDAMMGYLLDNIGAGEINITPASSIYMGDESNDLLTYLYMSKGFKLKSCDLTVITRISPEAGFPREVLKDRVKSSISQSKRQGVTCRVSENVDIAYPIIEQDQKKFDKKPTHTLTELKAISGLFPGRILQFVAYKEEIPIAVVCLIVCNKRVAYTFYIDQLEEHAACRPLDYILNEILIWMKDKGCAYLDFGPSTFGYTPHRSLIFFKEGFGGKGITKNFFQYKVNHKTRIR